jgi:hypothetical protein
VYAPSANPFGRGYLRQIGRIQRYHAVGGANGTTWWWCLGVSCVGGRRYFPYYSYSRKPSGREFFVPARTLIVIFLLTRNKKLSHQFLLSWFGFEIEELPHHHPKTSFPPTHTIIHYYTLLYTFIHYYTLLYIIIHYCTLLYTIVHYYTLFDRRYTNLIAEGLTITKTLLLRVQ